MKTRLRITLFFIIFGVLICAEGCKNRESKPSPLANRRPIDYKGLSLPHGFKDNAQLYAFLGELNKNGKIQTFYDIAKALIDNGAGEDLRNLINPILTNREALESLKNLFSESTSDLLPAVINALVYLSKDKVLENLLNLFFDPDFIFPAKDNNKGIFAHRTEENVASVLEKLIKNENKPLKRIIMKISDLFATASAKGYDIIQILFNLHEQGQLTPYFNDIINFAKIAPPAKPNEESITTILGKMILAQDKITKQALYSDEELVNIAHAIPKLDISLHCRGVLNDNLLIFFLDIFIHAPDNELTKEYINDTFDKKLTQFNCSITDDTKKNINTVSQLLASDDFKSLRPIFAYYNDAKVLNESKNFLVKTLNVIPINKNAIQAFKAIAISDIPVTLSESISAIKTIMQEGQEKTSSDKDKNSFIQTVASVRDFLETNRPLLIAKKTTLISTFNNLFILLKEKESPVTKLFDILEKKDPEFYKKIAHLFYGSKQGNSAGNIKTSLVKILHVVVKANLTGKILDSIKEMNNRGEITKFQKFLSDTMKKKT